MGFRCSATTPGPSAWATSTRRRTRQYNAGYRAQWLPGFGIKGDYGLCDADATNLVHVAGTYNLPFGRGTNSEPP